MRRLVALLKADNDPDQLVDRMRDSEAEFARRAGAPEISLSVGVQLRDDPILQAALDTGREVQTIDALLQVESESATDEALVAVLAGLDQLLGDSLCYEQSTAVLGDIHVITPRVGDAMVAVASRRKPGMTLAEMHDHWLNRHAPMALEMLQGEHAGKIGYDQLHVDPDASRQASTMCGLACREIDALLQVWCRAPEDYLAIETNPEFAAKIYEDDLRFTDMTSLEGASLRTWSL